MKLEPGDLVEWNEPGIICKVDNGWVEIFWIRENYKDGYIPGGNVDLICKGNKITRILYERN